MRNSINFIGIIEVLGHIQPMSNFGSFFIFGQICLIFGM